MKTQSHNGRHRFSETLWRTFICSLRVKLIKDSDNAPQRRRIFFCCQAMIFGKYEDTCVLGFKTSLSVPDREPRIGHRQLKSGKDVDFIKNQACNTTKGPVVSACSRIFTFKIFVLTSLNIVQ